MQNDCKISPEFEINKNIGISPVVCQRTQQFFKFIAGFRQTSLTKSNKNGVVGIPETSCRNPLKHNLSNYIRQRTFN